MVKNLIMQQKNGNGLSNSQSQIFVDSDAFIALAAEKEAIRSWAEKTSRKLDFKAAKLVVSNFVFGEVVTLVSQELGLKRARESVDLMESTCSIIEATAAHRKDAVKKFFSRTSKNTRFTDCVNMAIMDELGIDTIFSHDIHYKQEGYKRLGIDGSFDTASKT